MSSESKDQSKPAETEFKKEINRGTTCPQCSKPFKSDRIGKVFDRCSECKIFVHCNKAMIQSGPNSTASYLCVQCKKTLCHAPFIGFHHFASGGDTIYGY